MLNLFVYWYDDDLVLELTRKVTVIIIDIQYNCRRFVFYKYTEDVLQNNFHLLHRSFTIVVYFFTIPK